MMNFVWNILCISEWNKTMFRLHAQLLRTRLKNCCRRQERKLKISYWISHAGNHTTSFLTAVHVLMIQKECYLQGNTNSPKEPSGSKRLYMKSEWIVRQGRSTPTLNISRNKKITYRMFKTCSNICKLLIYSTICSPTRNRTWI